ncbi:MAG: DUF5131 family protein [Luteolibacter sp.]
MAKETKIQWCDSTINPVMGCHGCELWPTYGEIINRLVNTIHKKVNQSRALVLSEVQRTLGGLSTASDVWYRRYRVAANLTDSFPSISSYELHDVIERQFRCYAGILHLRFGGYSLLSGERANPGYAETFERPEIFPGRMELASRWSDLRGCDRPAAPWLNGLPRLIFVSDMGDALSGDVPFSYFKEEIVENVVTEAGSRHVWQWLTKRPARMAEFAGWLQSEHGLDWPTNLVAMTSVTNRATRSRIDELKGVPAAVRGLSVEPLVEDVTLDLDGIDWVIVGGESGNNARPFDLAWARSLRDQCHASGVAFFVKQLGSNPVEAGDRFQLNDGHGGDWSEWPEDLRIREMPEAFRNVWEVETEEIA